MPRAEGRSGQSATCRSVDTQALCQEGSRCWGATGKRVWMPGSCRHAREAAGELRSYRGRIAEGGSDCGPGQPR